MIIILIKTFTVCLVIVRSHMLHVMRCLSCVKQAVFLHPCLFDSDDIMPESAGAVEGWGELSPLSLLCTYLRTAAFHTRVQQEEAVK